MREKLADLIAGTKYGKDLRTYASTTDNETLATDIFNWVGQGETAQKWIPVAEGLPSEYERWVRNDDGAIGPRELIVFIEGAEISTVLYFDGESFCDDEGNYYSVTHWMPMPQAPRRREIDGM